MRAADLHQGHLVPINGFWWAVPQQAYWMIRTDQCDRRTMRYLDEDAFEHPLGEAKPETTKRLICTISKELVLFPHDEARQGFIEPGKKFLDAVPDKVWTRTRFYLDDLFGQRLLFAHDEELAALNPAYVKLMDGPGEWRNDNPVKPFYRVDKGEVVAMVMPVLTELNFRLPVAA